MRAPRETECECVRPLLAWRGFGMAWGSGREEEADADEDEEEEEEEESCCWVEGGSR